MSNRRGIRRFAKLELKLKLSPPHASSASHYLNMNSSPPRSSTSSSTSPATSPGSWRWSAGDLGFPGCPSSPEPEVMFLVGCPQCLTYVMLPFSNPRCPRCDRILLLNLLDGPGCTGKKAGRR